MKWIVAIVLSVITYFILQSIDDDKARKENREISTFPKRLLLFFFVFIMYLIVIFYFNLGNLLESKTKVEKSVGGREFEEILEKNILNSIHDEIEIGLPPFK